HPPGEVAVAGDQGCPTARYGCRASQGDGDRQSLLMLVGRLYQRYMVERSVGERGRDRAAIAGPFVGRFRRAKRFADQDAPRRRRPGEAADLANLLAAYADGLDQLLQQELRMAEGGD